MNHHIAIVGAGMAGLAAGRRLAQAGIACTLFDKSRGIGGRMATRRVGDLQFDHGAQFFTAKGAAFSSLVAEWVAQGQAAQWYENDHVGVHFGAHVGIPGMTAPARAMAAELAVIAGCTVTSLQRDPAGWTLSTADGGVDSPANGTFSDVILAMPAPQVIPLAATAGVGFAALDKVRYAPCWTLMLAFDGPSGITAQGQRLRNGPIAWVARNDTKPGRSDSTETVVIHASPDWSRANLELAKEDAAAQLLKIATDALGLSAAPTYVAAHRWRYALVEDTAAAPCLWDAQKRLGACGDWAIGPRIEAAFDSGMAMAGTVLHAKGLSDAA